MTINLATFKRYAAEVATIAASVGVVLALVLNLAPAIHLPAADVAWLVVASSVLSPIVARLRAFAGTKVVVQSPITKRAPK